MVRARYACKCADCSLVLPVLAGSPCGTHAWQVPFGVEATTCTFVIQVGNEDYTVFIAATNEIKALGRRKLPWKLLACMNASKRDTPDNRVSLKRGPE